MTMTLADKIETARKARPGANAPFVRLSDQERTDFDTIERHIAAQNRHAGDPLRGLHPRELETLRKVASPEDGS